MALLHYGQRVAVIGWRCDVMLSTRGARELVGA
jgi:hypothetical protein